MGGRLPRRVDLGRRRPRLAPSGQLHLDLLVRRLREGRHRLARGAERQLSPGVPRHPRLQSAGLYGGLRLQRADVRPHPHPLPDEARGRAGLGTLAAAQLGPGAGGGRRQADRCDHRGRPRLHHVRPGHHQHRQRHRFDVGDVPVSARSGCQQHRLLGGCRRPAGRSDPELGHLHERGDRRRLVPLRLHLHLAGQSELHAPARRPLPLRGALPRSQDRGGMPRLQPLHAPRRPLAERASGNRRCAGSGHGARDRGRGSSRRRVHQGADRSLLPGARRQRPLPSRVRRGGGGRRRPVLLLERRQGAQAAGDGHLGLGGDDDRAGRGDGPGAGGDAQGAPGGRQAGPGAPGLRAVAGASGGVHAGAGRGDHRVCRRRTSAAWRGRWRRPGRR